MQRYIFTAVLAVGTLVLLLPPRVSAATAPVLDVPPGLSIAEIKMTGSEFVMLQNNTGAPITDLNTYRLYAFNSVNPLAANVSSSSQQLPIGILGAGQTILLSDGGATCGAAITADLSVSLTDSTGYLQVYKSDISGGILSQAAGDAVSWTSGTNPASGMISDVPSNSKDPGAAWYRYKNTGGSLAYVWQQADTDPNDTCQLNVVINSTSAPGPKNPGNQLLPGTPPPATIISVPIGTDDSKKTAGLPLADIGLKAPLLNEILPNPASPQTDADDEFIEIYNSNPEPFDLTGFKLQAVSTSSGSTRTYTFPSGTIIKPQSFAAYPSANISISLNNAGAQVMLLDPYDTVISQTEPYGKAEDGWAWALADGKWYWTTTSTPGKQNVIQADADAGGDSTKSGVGTVAGASVDGGAAGSGSAGVASATSAQGATLHPSVLVAVAAAALVYGLYEYRGDIANAVYKLRRDGIFRRKNRPQS
jgi:hypothetical protein